MPTPVWLPRYILLQLMLSTLFGRLRFFRFRITYGIGHGAQGDREDSFFLLVFLFVLILVQITSAVQDISW